MSRIQRMIAVVFLIIGLASLGGSAYLHFVPAIPPEYVGETEATITDISVGYGSMQSSGTRSERHSVLVAYAVEGVEYERELGYYNSGMHTGQKIGIQYDTRDPGRISAPGGRMILIIITLALGAAFAVIGAVLLRKPVPVFVNRRRVA